MTRLLPCAGIVVHLGLWFALPALAQTAAPPPAAAAPLLRVLSFEVLGNTLLAADVVQRRLVEFEGPGSLQRLRDAAAAVQELYRRAGYGGVVAYLPEQTPKDGVVRIRVVEGKLTRIDVSGQRQFSVENILASLPALTTGKTPEVRLIDAQIQIANESPAKSIQVLLQPGNEPGGVAARVTVTETPVQRYTARIDNTGTNRTGRWRAALGWQHANIGGRDHVFSAELQTAPEQPSAVAVLSAGYRAPLYAQSMAIDAYGAWSDVDAGRVASPAGDVQFSGRGVIAGLRANAYLPRYRNIDQRAALGLEWREYLNNCAIEGLPEGACGAAGSSVSVHPVSLSYSAQSVDEVRLALTLGLHANLALGGAHGAQEDFDAVRKGSKRRYAALRLSASATLPVTGFGVLAGRASAQYARQPLVPGEQFGLGGAQSVRGFEERELGGDSGLQITVEALSPNMADAWLGRPQADLRGLLFADAGWVANRQEDGCLGAKDQCRMGSLGIGLRASWQQLQLRLDLARAMSTANSTRKGNGRLHAGLGYNF